MKTYMEQNEILLKDFKKLNIIQMEIKKKKQLSLKVIFTKIRKNIYLIINHKILNLIVKIKLKIKKFLLKKLFF